MLERAYDDLAQTGPTVLAVAESPILRGGAGPPRRRCLQRDEIDASLQETTRDLEEHFMSS